MNRLLASNNTPAFLFFLLLAAFVNWMLTGSPVRQYENLHLALDVANGLLSILLALFLWGHLQYVHQQSRQYLALVFAFAAAAELLHALVGIEWFGPLAWMTTDVAWLRPATWSPAAYILPIGMVWSLWLSTRQSRLGNATFSAGMAALLIGLYALALYLPPYHDLGLMGIQRPIQLPLLLILAGVIYAYARHRDVSPLFGGMAMLAGFLLLSDLAMLASSSPHEQFAMMAHVDKLAGYGLMLVILMRVVTRDGIARVQAEAALRECERYNHTLFEGSPIGLALTRMDGTMIDVNPAFARIIGRTVDETKALSYWDITPQSYAGQEQEQLRQLSLGGHYGPDEKEYIHKDGHRVAVRLSGQIINRQFEPCIWSSVEDISARKQAESSMHLAELVYQNSSEGVMITDDHNRIVAVNPAFEKMTGYSQDEVIGKDPAVFASDQHDQAFFEAMWNQISTTGHWQGEVWDKRKNGVLMAKWLTINTIHNTEGDVQRYVSLFSDITEKKVAEELIWKQANFDSLTHLPNRDRFRDHLNQDLIKASRTGSTVALLLIDLDHFKEVNDTLGHDIGDTLLQEAARRILASVRESDVVSRLGGDEFTVTISDLPEIRHLDEIAQKLIDQLAAPYQLGSETVHVSASIGVSLFPNDAIDLDTLMKNSDQAMYAAKSLGRNRFGYFTPAMQKASQTRLRLSNELRVALERQEFVLHYQPQICLETGWVIGLEALVRWQHPTRGLIPPNTFIPIAEENGLILPLGEWVLDTACRQLKQWLGQGMKDMRMSVNLSARQFRQTTLAATVTKVLEQTGLEPASLELEITESLAMDNPRENALTLAVLREIGIELSIDDFGTGHSSLGYLKDFPITRLKLDRSFIMHIETEPDDAIIVAAAINLAHALGLQVIAEGVEAETQVDYLARLNCNEIQGYFFCRPLPADEVEKYVRKKNAFPNMLHNRPDMPSIHVLVIDDDEYICKYLNELFVSLGHQAAYAMDPVLALAELRQHPGKYDLLLVDMLMPNMSGVDLVKEIRRCCLDATLIVISATRSEHVRKTLKPLEKQYGLIPGVNYFVLEKPLSVDDITRITDKVFDRPAKLLLNA